MIDLIQLHEALRWSGLGPDVPFHATDSSHEMKMRKFLEELGDTQLADEVIDELKEELEYAEGRISNEQEESRRLSLELEERDSEIRHLCEQLRARANEEAAQ
jgi:hypothetical protein